MMPVSRPRRFAIYQNGRAGPPGFFARFRAYGFDRDQFLLAGIDL
jgi:hypothetical protein